MKKLKIFNIFPFIYVVLLIYTLPYIVKYLLMIDFDSSSFTEFCLFPPLGALGIIIIGGLSSLIINQWAKWLKIFIVILSTIIILATSAITLYYLKFYCTIVMKGNFIILCAFVVTLIVNIAIPSILPILYDELFSEQTLVKAMLYAFSLFLFYTGFLVCNTMNDRFLLTLIMFLAIFVGGIGMIILSIMNIVTFISSLSYLKLSSNKNTKVSYRKNNNNLPAYRRNNYR